MKSIFDKVKYLLAVIILQIELINKFIDSTDKYINMNQSRINLINSKIEQRLRNKLIILN